MKATLPALVLSISFLWLAIPSGRATESAPVENAWADLRLPLPELKAFLDASEKAAAIVEPAGPPVAAAVLSARLSLDWPESGPTIEMKLETENFTDAWQALPILDGGAVVTTVEPSGARLILHENRLCVLLAAGAKESLTVRQSLPADGNDHPLVLPPTATISLEITRVPEGSVIGIKGAGDEVFVERAGSVVLPATTGQLVLKRHDQAAIAKLTAPPQPSVWSWQHEVAVVPEDGELSCTAFTRIAAGQGSGLEATATLPPDARSPQVDGEDLNGPPIISRQEDGSQRMQIRWKSRDQLDRQFLIRYRLPVGPLDTTWTLSAPRPTDGQNLRARYIIATDPAWVYEAEGLSAPTVSTSLPGKLTEALGNRPCRILDGGESVKIALTARAVAETNTTVIHEANWQTRIEPDGAGLHEGTMVVDHRGAAACLLDLPSGSRLLSCTIDGKAIKPHRSGETGLEFPLPATAETRRTQMTLAYTSRTDTLHPVEGTLPLSLPRSTDFIRTIQWTVVLPGGYQAETHGNVQRQEPGNGDTRNTLRLGKNLCRDERPEATVFYQRANLSK